MALINIEDLQKRQPITGWAPFALGFRPFFLAAGLFAVALMLTWLAILRGDISLGGLSSALWHGHEMLFGFALAVIAGFLLTAAQNWTGIPTVSGTPLAGLFLLWLLGRVAFAVPALPVGWVVAIDFAFLPVFTLALAIPILKAKQLHNYPFPIMLLALVVANALMHAEMLGWTGDTARTGLYLATYVVVTMMAVMGGRVIPSFTDNKLRTQARHCTLIEWAMPVVTVGALLAALLAPVSLVTAILASLAAFVHARRLAGWYTSKFWAVPLLWVLHLGYAWIAIGFALLALSAFGVSAATGSALHAFTAGAIGVLTLGMMARVSLGHTGRMLEPPRVMTLAFIAVNLGALIRVVVPLILPGAYATGMLLAGLAWAAAFALFAARYSLILLRPRVDGKPG